MAGAEVERGNHKKDERMKRLLVLMLLFCSPVYANTVHLKSGVELKYPTASGATLSSGWFGAKDRLIVHDSENKVLAVFYFDDVSYLS